jgi:3-hydroxybutyryl-CoA dehydratase
LSEDFFEVGESVSFSKTVGESDVYLFAGITGDFSPNHVDEEYMSTTPYKHRVAHGALSVGFASTASTLMVGNKKVAAVSYGYDRIRFIRPVYVGDTITVNYTIAEVDEAASKTYAEIEIVNQRGELCTVARHILKLMP